MSATGGVPGLAAVRSAARMGICARLNAIFKELIPPAESLLSGIVKNAEGVPAL